MRVLLWHVHGGYTDAFVRGRHEYLLPVDAARDAWGGGLLGRDWPAAREVSVEELHDTDIDVVVLQRPEEIALAERWTSRRPGRELPAIYLEHNTPKAHPTDTRHPIADRDDIVLVHVTHFNRLFWDNGRAPTRVVEHGVPDPGALYTGELARAAVVVNEPARRGRITGTDLLPRFGAVAPVDVFGMGAEPLAALPGVTPAGDLRPERLRVELARRRLYLHPLRWTSLGLALLEAMHLGMPVVGLATTEAPRAVPPEAGLFTNDLDALAREIRALIRDPELAAERGRRARRHVLEHYGLETFLHTWDAVLADTVDGRRVSASPHLDERSAR
ncbi:glycosyltransferase [uncultured Microbacterium sp.]|uniref:glycosyltransferase n=1 Tax=uncultured Microbacterium sp. TaxID=191216 RepID=UPI0025E008A8|nr:glycosyltransferase [uncultured Microbacterium sp.]